MPCDTTRPKTQTIAERRREIADSLAALERSLNKSRVEVVIGADGSICFRGWGKERNGVTDVCAYRALLATDSWELRKAISSAEMRQGRKVNQEAVAAGIHSHDGGRSWSTH